MNLPSYNSNIILPSYNDGSFNIYRIKSNTNVTYPDESLIKTDKKIWFNEISISDSLKITSSDRKIAIVKKIRISQNKKITSNHVLEINGVFYKVFNIYHFVNKNGFLESDITLSTYEREIKIEEEKL